MLLFGPEPMESLMNVFISSTFKDLPEYRKAAIEVVRRFNCKSTAMEEEKGVGQINFLPEINRFLLITISVII
jgi:hypothetical protein